MPPVFKTLASISVWILFILGCALIIVNLVMWAGAGFGTEDWQSVAVYDALGVTCIFLSVVAMKLRKTLE